MCIRDSLRYWDPNVDGFAVDGIGIPQVADATDDIADADLVLLLADHEQLDVDSAATAARAMLDTRGVTKPGMAERL